MSLPKEKFWCWWCGISERDGSRKVKWSVDAKALASKITLIIITFGSLFVSLYPLITFKGMETERAYFFGVFSVVLVVMLGFLVWYEVSISTGKRVYPLVDKQGIKNYMLNWIENGGRVAIWSRDLSWVDEEAKEVLTVKARNKELILCLPSSIGLSKELEECGADVYCYGSVFEEGTNARFTIAFYGRDGSKVAVGRTKANKHVIEEFGSGEHPAFYLAYDLVKFAKSVSKQQ